MISSREFLVKLFSMYPTDTFTLFEYLINNPVFGSTPLMQTTRFGKLFVGMYNKQLTIIAKSEFLTPISDNPTLPINPAYLDEMLKIFLKEKDIFKNMLVFI